MEFIASLIVVEDLAKSRRLYEELLGQTVAMDHGVNVTFSGGFAIHQRDHFRRLIDERDVSTESNAFELYFEDDDLDSVEALAEREGLEFVHRTREQPWRQRVVRFRDYDGHLVEVGERLEHLAYRLSLEGMETDEISRITSLAAEKVRAALTEYAS